MYGVTLHERLNPYSHLTSQCITFLHEFVIMSGVSHCLAMQSTADWSSSASQYVVCFADCHYMNNHSLRDKMLGGVPCCILFCDQVPSTLYNPTIFYVPKTFNTEQFYVLHTQCISLFYMDF